VLATDAASGECCDMQQVLLSAVDQSSLVLAGLVGRLVGRRECGRGPVYDLPRLPPISPAGCARRGTRSGGESRTGRLRRAFKAGILRIRCTFEAGSIVPSAASGNGDTWQSVPSPENPRACSGGSSVWPALWGAQRDGIGAWGRSRLTAPSVDASMSCHSGPSSYGGEVPQLAGHTTEHRGGGCSIVTCASAHSFTRRALCAAIPALRA
jgi:hypothetical protein